AARIGVAQRNDDLGVMVLPLREVFAAGREAASAPAAARPRAAIQPFEEVAEVGRVGAGVATAGKFESGIPVWRRTEVLPLLPIRTELIVGSALFGILQNLVGFARVLELAFGARLLVDIRMISARQLAIGAFDVVL